DAALATHRPQRDSRVAGQSSDLLPDGSAQVTGAASDDPWVRHEGIEAGRTYAAVTWPPTADSESADRNERLDLDDLAARHTARLPFGIPFGRRAAPESAGGSGSSSDPDHSF